MAALVVENFEYGTEARKAFCMLSSWLSIDI
jgi:hypothetical protein